MPETDPPLGDYLEEWLGRRRSQLRPTTLRCYRQTINSYLVPHLGDHRLSQVDRVLLEELYVDLLAAGGLNGKPLSTRTVELTHVVLHRAMQDAVLDGLAEQNPCEHARRPKRAPDQVEVDDDLQVWTAAQTARFLRLVDDHPLRALWHLAVGTGARRGELLGLRWCDVDLEAGSITIRRALTAEGGVPRLLGTKTSRARTLSISAEVVDALRQWRRQQDADRTAGGRQFEEADRWGLVFTDPDGGPIRPMAVTVEFRRLVRELDVPVVRFHDLRHTHATLLLERNVPVKVVSERLGHTMIAMTMDIYAHTLPAMDQDAASRFDAAVHGTTAP